MYNRAPSLRMTSRLLASLGALLFVMSSAGPALAQSPSPNATAQPSPAFSPDLRIQATPLLGGHVRPGAWAAVNVLVTNNGPAVSGELRIRGPAQNQSRYGVEANLPNGAKQQFTLYAQTAVFGSRINIELVNGDQVLQTQQVRINPHDASPAAAVIAERPERLLEQVTDAMLNLNEGFNPIVIRLGVPDLPARVEAWAALDRLVWQDVDASLLTAEQMEALRLWLGAGGELVVLGGTTDPAFLGAFNRDGVQLLPYQPTATVEVQPADLTTILGTAPATAAAVPAVAGTLDHGSVLARSGDNVVAASASYGRGSVALVGFDPSVEWIAGSQAGEVLWQRLLPARSGPMGTALNPLIVDDSQIVYALQNLPSIDLPPIEQLFVLLIGYIALVGPINYLILRRLDKREWAWVTIPALVVVFAFGSYGLGATLKGSDVIVNQITVVRAAQGTGRGIGQAYIGIYSPTRRSFDVRVPGGALLSNPTSMAQFGQSETPLDVVFGEANSRLRGFEVGFGVLRGFRAEAPADAPAVDADLHLGGGRLTGTVTNRSDTVLENVAVVYNGAVQALPVVQPSETKEINVDVAGNSFLGGLSERIFGSTTPRDSASARTVTTRRAVIDQLFPWDSRGSTSTPLLLAWRDGPVIDVDLPGDRPNRVGDGLFMIPLSVTLDSLQVFGDQMMTRTVVDNTSNDGWADENGINMSRGTMTIETRPSGFEGTFRPSSLEIAITQGEVRFLRGDGEVIAPLPLDQQPPQDDPVDGPDAASNPSPAPPTDVDGGGGKPLEPDALSRDSMPDFQLFDRTTQLWAEFAHPRPQRAYVIANPERYVDEAGAVLFRFVNRSDDGQFEEEQLYFNLVMRLEGSIS